MKSIVSPIFRRCGCVRSFVCVAAVLVVWLLSAGQAKASCGYYVVTGNPSAEMMASQEAMQAKHQASQTPGKDCPCRGPDCSAGRSDAAIPAAVPVSSASDQVASFAATTSLLEEVRGVSVVRDFSIESESYLLSLDPPPRFPL